MKEAREGQTNMEYMLMLIIALLAILSLFYFLSPTVRDIGGVGNEALERFFDRTPASGPVTTGVIDDVVDLSDPLNGDKTGIITDTPLDDGLVGMWIHIQGECYHIEEVTETAGGGYGTIVAEIIGIVAPGTGFEIYETYDDCMGITTYTCTDSDEDDIYTAGTVTILDGVEDVLEDHCALSEDNNRLFEYVCADGHLGYEEHTCTDMCILGKCMLTTGDWCEDSDGGENNVYIKDSVTIGINAGSEFVFDDFCYSSGSFEQGVYEGSCDGNSVDFGFPLVCEYGCEDGACVPEGRCVDTDGGIVPFAQEPPSETFYTKGSASGYLYLDSDVIGTVQDRCAKKRFDSYGNPIGWLFVESCDEDCGISEAHCYETYEGKITAVRREFDCRGGCSNGVCIANRCTDAGGVCTFSECAPGMAYPDGDAECEGLIAGGNCCIPDNECSDAGGECLQSGCDDRIGYEHYPPGEAQCVAEHEIDWYCCTRMCADTDGGINYYVAGRTGMTPTGPYYDQDYCQLGGNPSKPWRGFYADSCSGPDCYLIEMYCDKGSNAFSPYNCPGGCELGKCKGTECVGVCDNVEAACPTGYEPGAGTCNTGDRCCVPSESWDPDSCTAYGGHCVSSSDCYGYPANRISSQDSACRPVGQGGAGEGFSSEDVYCCKMVDCSTLRTGATCMYDVTCWNTPYIGEIPEGNTACHFFTGGDPEYICCGAECVVDSECDDADSQTFDRCMSGVCYNAGTLLSIKPSIKYVNLGETFTVNAYIEQANNFYGYETDLNFNSNVLELVSQTGGNGILGTNTFFIPGVLEGGRLKQVAEFLVPPSPSVSGAGNLVSVTFRARAKGSSTLTLSGISLYDAQYRLITDFVSDSRGSIIKVF
ncbi:MAG: hypothetical protein JXB14_06490 [Candidatus Altiarchaeota archaeon]|nr:hypothetical protein [Candidatus Altiarchaeota archaeon]